MGQMKAPELSLSQFEGKNYEFIIRPGMGLSQLIGYDI
jgi:hypothetical protein